MILPGAKFTARKAAWVNDYLTINDIKFSFGLNKEGEG